jgi:glycerate 2-kinase
MHAGAWIDAGILDEAKAKRIDPVAQFANNDSYGFFDALDRLVVTSPTLANVNDFRVILIR